MPDYKKGKIYKLISKHTNKIYVGSTTLDLNIRLHKHRTNYKCGDGCNSAKKIMKYDEK